VLAYVKRREPRTAGTPTWWPTVHSTAATPELFAPDDGSPFTPVLYSRFLGGRGRPVAPASQDVILFQNPATAIGGEGSSWDWEHLGGAKIAMPSSLVAVNRSRSINRPRTRGFLPWAVRANEYRPPWQSFSQSSDQAAADINPDASTQDDAGTPIGGW
jgi:hypothetical protein